ncbi:SAP domain-containing ribonucleoprotein-like isoform X2 [Symsagittifera roscoffensis]|uniref:SAP domain-containing ribonucleoprotein-like isoform X2 n=1 Tax=Symsagittifera roscoffensis TaxID=84072 RepID=UPI00307BED64
MPVAVNDLKTMTVPELKKLLMEYKLNVSGKKQDLITRLTEYLNAPTEKAAPEPEKEIQSEQPKVKPATKTTAVPQQAKDSTKENNTPKEETVAVKSISEMTEAEKLQRRAEKFGTKNDELKKAERAERFGVVLSSSSTSVSAKEIKANDVNVDPETLKRRAERFGEVTNSKLAKIEDSEKKSERAKRFGVPNSDPSAETAAKEARAERFKTQLGNPDDEMKKKRAEKFGLITAA